jgi:tetratricopeptide (TPR) repeat protein
LSETYSQLAMDYTDGSGRYRFKNLSSGSYYIQVDPAGTEYERQMQRIDVNPLDLSGRGGAEAFHVDFALKPPKPGGSGAKANLKGVAFYQPVPEAAKAQYEKGVKAIDAGKDDESVAALKEAIAAYPDYYDALTLLGTEYVNHQDFESAVPILKHAVEVNKKGAPAFYALGVALIGAGQREDGINALKSAVAFNPDSVNANMRLGLELANDEQKHSKAGDDTQAKLDCTEAIKALKNVTRVAGKDEPRAYILLARLYSKYGQYKEAADALDGYLKADSKSDQRDAIQKKAEEFRQKAKNSGK